ncbi:MAG: RagB/SusD family nutrient uptake outer membrane protein [Parabacteroides sp.]
MNKQYTIGLLLALLLSGSACDSVLDKDPVLEISSSAIFASPEKIETNLKGVYVQAREVIGKSLYLYTDLRGDDLKYLLQNGGGAINTYEMVINNTSSVNVSIWNDLYTTINEANIFMANLDEAEELEGVPYARYRAEAKFIRALAYYYLNTLYALPYNLDPESPSVPLRLLAETGLEHNGLARSSCRVVWDQVLADLSDETLAALPADLAGTYEGTTRATQAAVHALRQRVYLERGEWEQAVREGEAITGYALTADIRQNFTTPYYTSETIFSFPFAETNQSALGSYFYQGVNTVVDDTYGIVSYPLYSQAADVRFSSFLGEDKGAVILTKFPDYVTGSDWAPIFRYAETLLNLSEAYDQLGNEAKAKELLLRVRRRSLPQAQDALDESRLTGTYLQEAIYQERRLEFLGEAQRSLDIHRRVQTYEKQKGSVVPIVCAPSDPGYIWPIPLVEYEQNDQIN